MGAIYRESRCRARSAEGRDDERAFAVRFAIGPALRDDLGLGPEAHAFLAVLADVAEARALPPAEAVVADRHGDRHVDADHPDIDARREFARGMAVAGEDGDPVAIFVLRRELQRGFEIRRSDHL